MYHFIVKYYSRLEGLKVTFIYQHLFLKVFFFPFSVSIPESDEPDDRNGRYIIIEHHLLQQYYIKKVLFIFF